MAVTITNYGKTTVGQAEVDALFSDGTDFLFSDGTDYVFLEATESLTNFTNQEVTITNYSKA